MANFNVVKDYDWTSVPRGSGLRKDAPKIYVRSYKYTSSESLNRISSYIKATAQSDPDEYYRLLYSDAVEEEDTFSFPYLQDSIRDFTNNYGDTFNMESLGALDSMMNKVLSETSGLGSNIGIDTIAQNAKKMVGNVGKTVEKIGKGDLTGAYNNLMSGTQSVGSKPGSNVENPKLYQYDPSDSGVNVGFVLSNTINSDWQKNYDLVKKLIEINRPRRTSFTFMEPPRIYKIKIPGLRYIEWASCSNFSVKMIGTKRQIAGNTVPEGYLINMTFTSLTIEVNNFMERI
jgi:hypothetical protein